ncbi:hypothetical protein Nmel_009900, partial [Mimus melanotis]
MCTSYLLNANLSDNSTFLTKLLPHLRCSVHGSRWR